MRLKVVAQADTEFPHVWMSEEPNYPLGKGQPGTGPAVSAVTVRMPASTGGGWSSGLLALGGAATVLAGAGLVFAGRRRSGRHTR
ncbi:hypothetical protein ABT095_04375 [Kitasatospora sp. NPDC002227]|uniref:hypothetical protein n=1 Tax=Kitasatospora sp. NPDC002227 TaxID=3154773 RepID=UPI003331F5A0